MSHPGPYQNTQPNYYQPQPFVDPNNRNQQYGNQVPSSAGRPLDAPPAHSYPYHNLEQPLDYRTQPHPYQQAQFQTGQPNYTGGNLNSGPPYLHPTAAGQPVQHPHYYPRHTGQQYPVHPPNTFQNLQAPLHRSYSPNIQAGSVSGFSPHLAQQPSFSPSPIPSPIPTQPQLQPQQDAYIDPREPSVPHIDNTAGLSSIPPIPTSAPASTAPAALKIKLNIASRTQTIPKAQPNDELSAKDNSMSRRASYGNESYGGRPARSSRGATRKSYADPESDEDAFPEEGEGEDYDDESIPREAVPARSSRNRHAPKRYAEEQAEDAYEVKPRHPGPNKHAVATRKSSRSSRSHPDSGDYGEALTGSGEQDPSSEVIVANRRKAFPPRAAPPAVADLFDDDDNGPPPPMESQDTQTDTPRTRRTRNGKSRQSSEGSFAPDQSDAHSEQSESDDPIANDFIRHDDEDFDDDLESESDRPRRRQKQIRQVARRPATRTSARNTRARNRRQDRDDDDDEVPFTKRLRERKSAVNYALPPADLSAEILQDAIASASRPGGGPGRPGVGRAGGVRFGAAAGKALPWSSRGRDLAHAMGDPDTSDSDDFVTPLKSAGGAGPSAVAAGGAGRSGGAPTDVQNFGRINPKSSTADADPLGVDMNVTFDNVGGLDNHINQLKEMVALPLLYPELFQQFGITPPRGVLFHGPPGTGKTLLARALAASCSTGNTKIAFFMRKGADVLSKWVGEAERQLRMLFEEARAAQPSIIFFDEIDGLAPVRSSKQDQIHASLVSTLLALMDGMDGRGQVIVIGATNRPDAVDPALRRPGRFDREFYFPLPNREARKKIIGINTRKWEPALSPLVLDQLAGLTKGYGGADLRALCTEAALNAIQRRYPQIYKTSDRLLLEPGSIQVQAKDFMMSVKKIVPSSARSTSSAAAPLPAHLLPLLSSSLDRLKKVIDNALPSKRNVSALEEAEFEEEEGDSFAKHSMLQSLDKMRTYRPRILVHGQPGMGQAWLGPAILHHLEGFHVQSLDLATLMGDSTRSVEAGLVQLFVEAKRHQPSVIFIPSLSQWASAISDVARSTLRALLDGVPASDPILILALVDGELRDLPRDVRAWFGLGKDNRVALDTPSSASQGERSTYFAEIISTISMPPTEFPDALPRRKRVLEILPPAPPLPPRVQTEAEIAKEHEKDVQAREMMIISFTGLMQDFMRKFRKVTATVREDAMALSEYLREQAAPAGPEAEPTAVNGNGDGTDADPATEDGTAPNGPAHQSAVITEAGSMVHVDTQMSSLAPIQATAESSDLSSLHIPTDPAPVSSTEVVHTTTAEKDKNAKSTWQAHNLDIDIMSIKLSRHKYLTPSDFLADIGKIEQNADKLGDPDRITKIGEMGAHARMHVLQFDPAWEPRFEAYAERVRQRKAKKQKEKEDAKRLESGEVPVTGTEASDAPSEAVADTAGATAAEVDTGNSLKRPRESGEDIDERGEKRPREDIVMEDASIPAPLPAEERTATVPPPRPTYPPFVVHSDTLSSLSTTLIHATAAFTVEQLEQLRAACFDKIWRHRADWDRAECMRQVRTVIVGLVEEVGELNDDREDSAE